VAQFYAIASSEASSLSIESRSSLMSTHPTHAAHDVIVRPEEAGDYARIGEVNVAAFGGTEEAVIVEALRREGAVLLSLVAVLDGVIVGHILFSRMSIETSGGSLAAVALAPMAVMPEQQRRGIGGKLITAGLAELRRMGERIVLVVGHAGYYPRFGFSTDRARALESPFPVEVFMALELSPAALEGIQGRVKYPAAFGL
jgi:putative acetyltransferase